MSTNISAWRFSAIVWNSYTMNCVYLYEYVQFHLPGGNPYVQALNQFHVFGATQICSGCTVANCLLMCTLDGICQGVDYDSRTTSCWRHTAATVCGTPVSKAFCSHYSKMNCRKYGRASVMSHKCLLTYSEVVVHHVHKISRSNQ